jgi:hypothetical protein
MWPNLSRLFAIYHYDEQFKRWRTDITKQAPGDKPRQWPFSKG